MGPDIAAGKQTRLSRIGYMVPIAGLILAIYGTTLVGVFDEWWNSTEQSQGLVIVPFALLIAWLRRRSVRAVPAQVDLHGLILVAAGCSLLLLGKLFAGSYLSAISFVVVVSGLIWTFWGLPRVRALSLPILLLILAIPIPTFIYATLSMPLQQFVSKVACNLADQLGVVIYREGNILHMAGITVGVWEACSGLHSLSALMAGGILMGFTICNLPLTRTLVWVAAIPIAVVMNIARVTGTAVLADWHPAYAMGFYHLFSGWLVFVTGACGLYMVAVLLRRAIN